MEHNREELSPMIAGWRCRQAGRWFLSSRTHSEANNRFTQRRRARKEGEEETAKAVGYFCDAVLERCIDTLCGNFVFGHRSVSSLRFSFAGFALSRSFEHAGAASAACPAAALLLTPDLGQGIESSLSDQSIPVVA